MLAFFTESDGSSSTKAGPVMRIPAVFITFGTVTLSSPIEASEGFVEILGKHVWLDFGRVFGFQEVTLCAWVRFVVGLYRIYWELP